MKTITLTFMLLVSFIFLSCREVNTPKRNTEYVLKEFRTPLVIVEIDSCEYLFGDWGGGAVLTHKGNCKFCSKRTERINQENTDK